MHSEYNDGSKKFLRGIFSLKNKDGQGSHSEVNDNLFKAWMESDPYTRIKELAKKLAESKSTATNHLEINCQVYKLDK